MSDDKEQPNAPQPHGLDHGAAAADFFALARQIAAPPWADEETRYKALKQTLRAATALAEAEARGREMRHVAEANAVASLLAAKRKASRSKRLDAIVNSLPAILGVLQTLDDDREDPEGAPRA